MDDIALGRRFRALRHRLGWRQADLAGRAGVSQDRISRIERGRFARMPLSQLRQVANALDAEFVSSLRWRGGDLDRLVDEGHARLVGQVASVLGAAGWLVRPEVSYAVYGERGSIDLLAWHPGRRIALVVEVKTELVSVEETLRKHDEKARLAPGIAAERFGWRAVGTGRLLVLPSRATSRRQVTRQAAVFEVAYPLRGLELRRWLGAPAGASGGPFAGPAAGPFAGPAAGILFVGDVAGDVAVTRREHQRGRKRIRNRVRRGAGPSPEAAAAQRPEPAVTRPTSGQGARRPPSG